MHPIVKFYVMRYKNGKKDIPKQWASQVMTVIEGTKKLNK